LSYKSLFFFQGYSDVGYHRYSTKQGTAATSTNEPEVPVEYQSDHGHMKKKGSGLSVFVGRIYYSFPVGKDSTENHDELFH